MTRTTTYKIFIAFILLLFSGACSLFAQNEQKEKIALLFGGDLYFGETYQERQENKGNPNILKTQGYEYCLMKMVPLLKKANQVNFNQCVNCKTILKSKLGGCCVFCSYGTAKCPSKQQKF